jgi:hypothetical protein
LFLCRPAVDAQVRSWNSVLLQVIRSKWNAFLSDEFMMLLLQPPIPCASIIPAMRQQLHDQRDAVSSVRLRHLLNRTSTIPVFKSHLMKEDFQSYKLFVSALSPFRHCDTTYFGPQSIKQLSLGTS